MNIDQLNNINLWVVFLAVVVVGGQEVSLLRKSRGLFIDNQIKLSVQ